MSTTEYHGCTHFSVRLFLISIISLLFQSNNDDGRGGDD